MKQKTLVIILGQARADKLCWSSFKKNVLEELDADLALCVGKSSTNDNSNLFWANAKFRWEVPEYDDFGDGFDQLQKDRYGKITHWRKILQVQNQWLGGIKAEEEHPGSGGLLIYFRAKLYDFLVKEDIISSYQRFVITRSDFIWEIPHPKVERLNPRYLWFPYGEFYGGLTDRHVIISSEHLNAYLNLIDPILHNTDQLIKEMLEYNPYPIWNLEQYILFHLKSLNIAHKVRYIPYMMFSVRKESTPTRWAEGVYDPDLDCLIKYPSEKSRTALTKKYLTDRSGKIMLFNNYLMVMILKSLFFLKKKTLYTRIRKRAKILIRHLLGNRII
ncbi:hypothetical protein [Rhodohalobacter sulfatireducens]|uniref:Uncharacterized protein n=1 Tax=Rhodohalobacter sulfatireducens TaxID=2911366 RepID=A0ABS9K9E6_9BACT|nr:hypothetical protein [Rhodohalobacter sulfatireducens]MCG2587438.1 hypothetical protein [Rhodohalobacter sulfatireducens]